MAVTQVGTATTNAGTNSITITKPTGVADGDLLLLTIASNAATFNSGISGVWTLVDTTQASGGGTMRSHLFYRVASSEGASYTITATTSLIGGAITAWNGVDTSAPLDDSEVASVANQTEPYTGPTATATRNVLAIYFRQTRHTSGTPSQSTAGSEAELYDFNCTGGGAIYNQAAYLATAEVGSGSVTGLATTQSATETHNILRTLLLSSAAVAAAAGTVTVSGTSNAAVAKHGNLAGTATASVVANNATVDAGAPAEEAPAGAVSATVTVPQPRVSAPRAIAVTAVANAATAIKSFSSVGADAFNATVDIVVLGTNAQAGTAVVTATANQPVSVISDTAPAGEVSVSVTANQPTIAASSNAAAGTTTASVTAYGVTTGEQAPAESVTASVTAFDVVGGGETILANAGHVSVSAQAFNQPMRGQAEEVSSAVTVSDAVAYIEYRAFAEHVSATVVAETVRAQTNRPVEVAVTAYAAAVNVGPSAGSVSASVTAEDSFIFLDRKVFPSSVLVEVGTIDPTVDIDDIFGFAGEVSASVTSYTPSTGVKAYAGEVTVSVTSDDVAPVQGEIALAGEVTSIWGGEVMSPAHGHVGPLSGTVTATAVATSVERRRDAGHAAATVTAEDATVRLGAAAGTVTASATAEGVRGAHRASAGEVNISGLASEAVAGVSVAAGETTAMVVVNAPSTDLDDILGLAEHVAGLVAAQSPATGLGALTSTVGATVTVEVPLIATGQPGPAGAVSVSVTAENASVAMGPSPATVPVSATADAPVSTPKALAGTASGTTLASTPMGAVGAPARELNVSVVADQPTLPDIDDTLGEPPTITATVDAYSPAVHVRTSAGTVAVPVTVPEALSARAGDVAATAISNSTQSRVGAYPSDASATVLAEDGDASNVTQALAEQVALTGVAYQASVRVEVPSSSAVVTASVPELGGTARAELVNAGATASAPSVPRNVEAGTATVTVTADGATTDVRFAAGTAQAPVVANNPNIETSGFVDPEIAAPITVTAYGAEVLLGDAAFAGTATVSAAAEGGAPFIGETGEADTVTVTVSASDAISLGSARAGTVPVSVTADDAGVLPGVLGETDDAASTVVAYGASIRMQGLAGSVEVTATAELGSSSLVTYAQVANTVVSTAYAMEPFLGRLAGDVSVSATAGSLFPLMFVTAPYRTEVVPSEDRTTHVTVDYRTFIVMDDGRTYTISAESRTIEVDKAGSDA